MKLKIILCFVVLYLSSLGTMAQQKAANDLIKRVIPAHYQQISTAIIAPVNGKDVFELDVQNGKIFLKGNNAVSIASALNWYLKYTCNAHVSWNGDQLNLPAKLPMPIKKERIIIDAKHRVMFNYCTFSYSMVWWDWKRWERELDFLAMNGINMPLTVVGLEGTWYNSLLRIGYTDAEARAFLVGPAYSAWQCMTNIESFAGPLPKSWIDSHIVLGKKIIDRELELGMKPIQQGFSGYVPNSLKEKFVNAKIQRTPEWCNFPGCSQLDPLDPLFNTFGKIFLEEQEKLFGKHGYYASDPFHEGEPPQNDRPYLNAVGESISKLFSDYDPKSTWVMQAWSIRKEIAEVVQKDKLLILDLAGSGYKKNDNFWGYNFVAGNLHNFGNRINLHGDIQLIASNQYQKVKRTTPNVVGSGLFMEGIMQNPLYYDLAFEMPLHTDSLILSTWLTKYAQRRYGHVSQNAAKAMQLLLETAYTKGTNNVENSSIVAARPAVEVKKSGPNAGFNIPYRPEKLIAAVDLLLKDNAVLSKSDGYRFDIVDFERQVLSNLGQKIHKQVALAFEKKDNVAFDLHTKRFITLLTDIDRLTSTRPELSFDKWTADAQTWAKTDEERKIYDFNASMLVTQWGPLQPESHIFDYSWREWGGLIGGYYLPRWQKFHQMLRDSLTANKNYSETGLKTVHGREALRANDFYNNLADWEIDWINSPKQPKTIQKGKELATVIDLQKKYRSLFKIYYDNSNNK